jgi:hypothetical protein
MNAHSDFEGKNVTRSHRSSSNALTVIIIVLAACAVLGAVLWFALSNSDSATFRDLTKTPGSEYPIGTPSSSEPSGMAPPASNALAGYSLSYENDFNGTTLPSGWYVFTGVPGGDPGGQFGASHVVVGSGLLQLNTFKDLAFNDKWVNGGLCQCGLSQTYGAYFVRSRITGLGPNEAEVLWPKANVWPPEIDFNETGGDVVDTSSTVHFGSSNQIDQRHLAINMTYWHTWGVIWTPTAITYIVDGKVWGKITVASEIPNQPMTLDFEQRSRCTTGSQCPTAPVSMKIDWVAEYVAK